MIKRKIDSYLDDFFLFRNYYDTEDLIFRITGIIRQPMVAGQTLLFFDEVQECPEVGSAIKFFVDNSNDRYVLSGSLLGF